MEDIKLGDRHYEFEYGTYIESVVTKLPERDESGYWTWESTTERGKIIGYGVRGGHSHYGPKLYDHMAYWGCKKLDI